MLIPHRAVLDQMITASLGETDVWADDARAHDRRDRRPRVGSDDRADVAYEQPDGERSEVAGSVDVAINVLSGSRVDRAVGKEDAEKTCGRGGGEGRLGRAGRAGAGQESAC